MSIFELNERRDQCNPIFIILCLGGWLLISLLMPTTWAQDADSDEQLIDIYLPINSLHSSDELNRFKADLKNAGLSSLNLNTVDYWSGFQQGLRNGRIGIYFSPPHFAAWAISQHNFIPLVHIVEELAYVIAVKRNDPSIFEVSDLAGRQVCARQPLNLDYLLVTSALKESLIPADIKIMEPVSEQMKNDKTSCDAFSVSKHVFEELELQDPERFIRLHQTEKYTNYGLIAHPDLDPLLLDRIHTYFLLDRSQKLLAPLLKEYASKLKLVRSSPEDYPPQYWTSLIPYWNPRGTID